jgi:hypothetical protein
MEPEEYIRRAEEEIRQEIQHKREILNELFGDFRRPMVLKFIIKQDGVKVESYYNRVNAESRIIDLQLSHLNNEYSMEEIYDE